MDSIGLVWLHAARANPAAQLRHSLRVAEQAEVADVYHTVAVEVGVSVVATACHTPVTEKRAIVQAIFAGSRVNSGMIKDKRRRRERIFYTAIVFSVVEYVRYEKKRKACYASDESLRWHLFACICVDVRLIFLVPARCQHGRSQQPAQNAAVRFRSYRFHIRQPALL